MAVQTNGLIWHLRVPFVFSQRFVRRHVLSMLTNVAAEQVRDVSFVIDFQTHVVPTPPVHDAPEKCVELNRSAVVGF